jgi:hypothetical protein
MLIGAKFGAQFANNLPINQMKRIFAAFMILIGFKMLFGK